MSKQNRDLEGKVALITGAGTGIGAVTARLLAEAGARVVLAGLEAKPVAAQAEAIRGAGLEADSHVVDIADEGSVKSLIDFTLKRYGRLDVLDNNAAQTGVADDGDVMSMSVDTWDRAMAVNARGTMLMCKHSVPAMIAAGGGSIINISSGTSTAGDFQATAYAASKGAVNTLTRYVATQFGSRGIRCNALVLGLVATDALRATLPPPVCDIFTANKLAGRLGEGRDVAEAVLFLASDRSSWITGQLLPVDGGFFAHVPTTSGIAALMAAMQQSAAR